MKRNYGGVCPATQTTQQELLMKRIFTGLFVALATTLANAQYEMRVTFDGYTGSETLSDFPALVVFTNNVGNSGFNFATHGFADPNAYDLRFYDAANNELDYEIDTYTPGALLLAWVKVPHIEPVQPGPASFINARWGDINNTQQPYTTNGAVWVEYIGVWHFGETATGTAAGLIKDSTTNQLHGARMGNVSGRGSVTPAVGQGVRGNAQYYHYDTRNNNNTINRGYVQVPHDPVLNMGNRFSASGWFKLDNPVLGNNNNGNDNYGRFFNKTAVINNNTINGWEFFKQPGPNWQTSHNVLTGRGEFGGNNNVTMPNGWDFDSLPRQWFHITMQYLGNNSFIIYVNGVAATGMSTLNNSGAVNNSVPLNLGGTAGSDPWSGYVDEMRITKEIRSVAWLRAEYQTMADPAFAKYAPLIRLDSILSLEVKGALPEMLAGEAEPAFGVHWDFPANTNLLVSFAPAWTNTAGTVSAAATGWAAFTNGVPVVCGADDENDPPVKSSDRGASFWYTHPNDPIAEVEIV